MIPNFRGGQHHRNGGSVSPEYQLSFNFKVNEPDNDVFTVVLDGTYPGITLVKGTNDYTVSLTPSYDSQRTIALKIKATDSNGYANSITVNISVIDVNRAPVATVVADKAYKTGTVFDKILASAVFTDPDNDKLTYSILVSDLSVVQLGVINTDFVIMPQGNGKAQITLSANDGINAPVETKFTVYVNKEGTLSVNEQVGSVLNVSIYPNPVKESAILSFSMVDNSFVNVQINDVLGQTVAIVTNENLSAGNKLITIHRANLQTGVYFVKITLNNTEVVTRTLVVE